tara:strand:- start:482 stop:655 length:174 start_codon:yes stop_codon:yes gene_type:complete
MGKLKTDNWAKHYLKGRIDWWTRHASEELVHTCQECQRKHSVLNYEVELIEEDGDGD